ncbi:MAG: 1-aminocyclopropane-1-carboxylate deaminase/D-cysteine desulfhydrase [Cyclobacteriaceae bacterium]|nr:1-aminocyclopropane-1-carboxylate deaminase/D-cysteine desulfhydrase [Cyclobacteriaceae bacterium]
MLTYTPTPVQEIREPLFDKAGVRVLVKREDLNHPYVSGNKWWKLKYNLDEAKKSGHNTLLTFGGAYSNHIYATAGAASESGFNSIGIIRGEETQPLNPTLTFAKEKGMQLHYVSRTQYRNKTETEFTENLKQQFGDFYRIPEGGTNELAVKGVTEFAQTLHDGFDYLCCAVGTGGTLAGLISGLPKTKQTLGFSVLKGGEFLHTEVQKFLHDDYGNWSLITSYHHGGYAKTTHELLRFITEFGNRHNLPLDQVYTGKLMWGVMEEIKNGCFQKGSTILILHTGGLQGRSANINMTDINNCLF